MKFIFKKTKTSFTSNVKVFIGVLFIGILAVVGCNDNGTINQTVSNSNNKSLSKGYGYTDPYLSGTFVDFWDKSNWSVSQWVNHIEEMELVGVERLIVQFTAYNQYLWCNSPNDYSTESYINALPNLLNAASLCGKDVYVGLYFNDEFWNNTADSNMLSIHAQRSINLANNIWSQYSGYSSFKGWYIPHEPAPYYYNSTTKFDKIKNYLINPIANHCKSISCKPVAISAFFNENLSTPTNLLYFMNRLGSCNVDIILLQDGTGGSSDGVTPHCSINNLNTYFNAAEWGLYGENPEYTGDFWADVETFKPNGSPENFNTVVDKLEIEDGYVTEIVTFQYFKDMATNSPHTGTNQDLADSLRTQYQQYYYEW